MIQIQTSKISGLIFIWMIYLRSYLLIAWRSRAGLNDDEADIGTSGVLASIRSFWYRFGRFSRIRECNKILIAPLTMASQDRCV
ncbi:MAG TPA: hypothetical protein VIF60_13840, partial [Burkholderiaceae bacterium]